MKNAIWCFLIIGVLILTGCSLKNPKTSGTIIHEGHTGGKEDSIAALQKMAESDPAAAYDLGLRYLRGDGITQNSYKGLQCLRMAGEHGDHKAHIALGKLYLTGMEEMGPDPMEAAKWLRLAAGQGDKESAKLLKKAQAARDRDVNNYVDPALYRWYWHAPYRLYWRHGAWVY
ncbi:MAG: hypothetical protein CSB24_03685 [Deltaproteobacteria bacterium]|nr:MAG: hypothetical protein CSB24_03685 [Deltaproteobacteria bacterium]